MEQSLISNPSGNRALANQVY
jgi:WD40 repeat protein